MSADPSNTDQALKDAAVDKAAAWLKTCRDELATLNASFVGLIKDRDAAAVAIRRKIIRALYDLTKAKEYAASL